MAPLQSRGYTNIQFVTDTNDQPPDFIVNNSIAVEVRRLNWMFGDEIQGLEGYDMLDQLRSVNCKDRPCENHLILR